jgi:hypothetical protein
VFRAASGSPGAILYIFISILVAATVIIENRLETRINRTISGRYQVQWNLLFSPDKRKIMAARVIWLGPGECPDTETGARYFAALAFPGAGEEQARLDAMRAWAGLYLHEANRVERSDDPFEDHRLNAFVQLPLAWCKAKVRTGRHRLRNRSDAARAVRPWMRESLHEFAPPHPRRAQINAAPDRPVSL